MVAERLGVAALCFADALTVRPTKVEIRRDDGAGLEMFTAALPAVVSVTERCGEPHYPRFVATVERPGTSWSAPGRWPISVSTGPRSACVPPRPPSGR